MQEKVFIVTGANKGIGFGIVETLAQQLDGAVIYLTARDSDRGNEAVSALKKILGDKLKSQIGFHPLQIDDETSVCAFRDYLVDKHGGFDVLINNAGIMYGSNSTASEEVVAASTIATNYYGTKLVSSHLVPLIRDGGRVVNVCSQAGVMKNRYHQRHIDKLHNAMSEQEIDEFVEEYKRSIADGTRQEAGFTDEAYRISKAAEIALTMVYHHRYPKFKINACCPGYVNTDMTGHKGPLSIQEGADTAVYLAVDDAAPNGKFVFERKAIDW